MRAKFVKERLEGVIDGRCGIIEGWKISEAFERKNKEDSIKKLHRQPWDEELLVQLKHGIKGGGVKCHLEFGPWKDIYITKGMHFSGPDPSKATYYMKIRSFKKLENKTFDDGSYDINREKEFFETYKEELIDSLNNQNSQFSDASEIRLYSLRKDDIVYSKINEEEIEDEEVEEIEEDINLAAMEKGKNVAQHPDKFKKVL